MSPQAIFQTHLILGYVAWLLCFRAYILPRLRDRGAGAPGPSDGENPCALLDLRCGL